MGLAGFPVFAVASAVQHPKSKESAVRGRTSQGGAVPTLQIRGRSGVNAAWDESGESMPGGKSDGAKSGLTYTVLNLSLCRYSLTGSRRSRAGESGLSLARTKPGSVPLGFMGGDSQIA